MTCKVTPSLEENGTSVRSERTYTPGMIYPRPRRVNDDRKRSSSTCSRRHPTRYAPPDASSAGTTEAICPSSERPKTSSSARHSSSATPPATADAISTRIALESIAPPPRRPPHPRSSTNLANAHGNLLLTAEQ